jgi:dihydrofolate synthase/folylpolyglutamate synthase
VAIDEAATKRGFSAARWPGRFEVRPGETPMVLDAAHSPQAALALRQALDDYFPDHKLVLVLGVSADKDLEGIIAPLRSRIEAVIATQSSHARAMPAAELQGCLAALGLMSEADPDAVRAVQRAQVAVGSGSLVLVAGSVFLVEEVREGIRDR